MSDDIKIKALKNLQLQYIEKEAKLFEKVFKLEVEFEKQLVDLYDKRQKLIAGGDLTVFEVAKVLEDGDNATKVSEPSGIPNFWLTAFEYSSLVGKIVEPYDRDILAYLYDVRVTSRSEPMGFDLEFHFQPNKYFENSVLTKSYEMRCEPDPSDPLHYDGPEIVSCKGCKIIWKQGMNITLDKTKKKQKEIGSAVRKFNEVDTFFNFFSPPSTAKRSDEVDEDIDEALEEDFEIGRAMREHIIPSAVLYYLDEDSDESSDDENDEADEDDEAYESENNLEIEPTVENGGVKC